MDCLVRDYSLDRTAPEVRAALGAGFSVVVFIKILVDTAFAECVKAFIDCVGVSEESFAEWALEPLMKILLLNSTNECSFACGSQHLVLRGVSVSLAIGVGLLGLRVNLIW